MLYIIVLLVLVIIFLIFFLYNIYNQNEQLEKFIEGSNKRETKVYKDAEKYYLAFLALFQSALDDMERVDKRGAFSSDDEVGFSFKVLKTAINNVVVKLQELQKETREEINEKE